MSAAQQARAGEDQRTRLEIGQGDDRVEVLLRLGVPDDRAFVLATWVRSYEPRTHGSVRRDVYLEHQGKLAERLLEASPLIIACSPSHESTIHGWCCADNALAVLHYAYVPPALRGLGLARSLILASFGAYRPRIETSHRWPWASTRFVYNPYRAGVAA